MSTADHVHWSHATEMRCTHTCCFACQQAPRLPEDFNTEADLLHLRDAIPQLEVWSEPWTKAELQVEYVVPSICASNLAL